MKFLNDIAGSGLNIFGAGGGQNIKQLEDLGLLKAGAKEKAQSQSLMRGLLGSVISYAAQPKNQGFGSGIPYIAKGLQQGMNQAQKPFNNLTSNIEQTRKLQEYTEAEAQEERMKQFRAGYGKSDKEAYLLQALQNNTISLEDYQKYTASAEGFKLGKDEVQYDANGNKIAGNVGNPWAEAGQTKSQEMISTINEDFSEYQKLDGVMQQLEDPNFKYFEGNFGDWKADVTKFLQGEGASYWSSKDWDEYLANTENLNAMLQMDVFRAIKDLGIGARGLDTPAERDFLIQVMTGNAAQSRAGLIALTKRRRDKAKGPYDA